MKTYIIEMKQNLQVQIKDGRKQVISDVSLEEMQTRIALLKDSIGKIIATEGGEMISAMPHIGMILVSTTETGARQIGLLEYVGKVSESRTTGRPLPRPQL